MWLTKSTKRHTWLIPALCQHFSASLSPGPEDKALIGGQACICSTIPTESPSATQFLHFSQFLPYDFLAPHHPPKTSSRQPSGQVQVNLHHQQPAP